MGGGHDQDPEAGKAAPPGHSTSGPLPPSAPPHLQGQDPAQYQYGTFQPPVGYPQPAPPPGFGGGYHQQHQPYAPAETYYAQGYQTAPGTDPIVCLLM